MERKKLEQVITFEHDSDEITPAARTILEDIARYLSQPEQENVNRLRLEVSLENVGSNVYDDNLSIKRSIAAQKVLKQKLALFRRKEIYYITEISAPEGNNTNMSLPQVLFFIEQLARQVDGKFTHICSLMLRHGWTSINLPQAYPEELKSLLQEGLSLLQPFEITDENWCDLTRIEAMVEFYMNYTNPWCTGEVFGETIPRMPGMDGYKSADLSSGWHLVLIDPCDGRLRGNKALVSHDKEDNDTVIKIEDDNVNLAKINPNFDTIYLKSGKRKTFRITGVNQDEKKLTLDSKVIINLNEFDLEVSQWHIPAGFSRELEGMDLDYNLGPGGNKGWDHYDGMMLIIKDGVVHANFPWSSYPSRRYNCPPLIGNRPYCFRSQTAASKAWINFAFNLYLDLYSNTELPGTCYCCESPGDNDDVIRTGGIFIHNGNRNVPAGGNSSQGCQVSPVFYEFRSEMIGLLTANNSQHPLREMMGWDRNQSESTFNDLNLRAQWANRWNNSIDGTFWLVRPDHPCS